MKSCRSGPEAVMPNKMADLLHCHRFPDSLARHRSPREFRSRVYGPCTSIMDRPDRRPTVLKGRRKFRAGYGGKRAAALYAILNRRPYRTAVRLDTQGNEVSASILDEIYRVLASPFCLLRERNANLGIRVVESDEVTRISFYLSYFSSFFVRHDTIHSGMKERYHRYLDFSRAYYILFQGSINTKK